MHRQKPRQFDPRPFALRPFALVALAAALAWVGGCLLIGAL